jgi:heme exporter protein A
VIEIAKLRVVFGQTVALQAIDLRIDPGVTGLFGPNGAGKSTLLRVVAGLLRPSGGGVSIGGVSVASSDEALRHAIGYSGHDSGLYQRLSARENLELFAGLYGVHPARVDAVLEQVGVAARATTPVGRLSEGLRRRASVARALLHEPEVLLLDEPYANLDDDAAALVSDAVRAWRAPGRVALVATHGAKRVKSFADAGIIMQRGRVISHRVRIRAEEVASSS